ncbi:neural/ectodermal development factor IMP-L2-like [Condylostylus longicornis]|uniref:neural/ectodermal development factor IMP-L2-like n=1 Tax=Condylostylus longicornis TaxID=2530218 RepID=UPI00244DCC33|nr:neural/ectodermal development factor IMP-L2-like [Condylostylus longicornis]XP_055384174.1 neural/ectodermal development factor IMP-L2-like [Condylostylus longicornis]
MRIFLTVLFALVFDVYCHAIIDNEIDNSIQIHSDPDEKIDLSEPHEWVKLTKVPPTNIYHDKGSIIEIECEALGTPIPEVQWVPGNVVRENNAVMFSGPSTLVKVRSVLIVERLKHTKTFSCVATAAGKQVIASTTVHTKKIETSINDVTQMRYEPRKPKIIYNYSLYLETVGSTILLPCKIAPNRLKIEKIWLDSSGNVISGENSRFKINSSGDLIIFDLKWDDMGAYKCVAENSIGRDAADTFVYPALNDD